MDITFTDFHVPPIIYLNSESITKERMYTSWLHLHIRQFTRAIGFVEKGTKSATCVIIRCLGRFTELNIRVVRPSQHLCERFD